MAWFQFSSFLYIHLFPWTHFNPDALTNEWSFPYLDWEAHFLSFLHSLLCTGPTSDKSPPRLSHWSFQSVRQRQKKTSETPFLTFQAVPKVLLGIKVIFVCHIFPKEKRLYIISSLYINQAYLWQFKNQQADQSYYILCPIHHCRHVLSELSWERTDFFSFMKKAGLFSLSSARATGILCHQLRVHRKKMEQVGACFLANKHMNYHPFSA